MVVNIPLGTSDWRRAVGQAPDIALVNRYFEKTPDPEHGPVSLLARPGLKRFVDVGQGPIRAMFTQAGSFQGDLFTIGYDTLYRVRTNGVVETIGGNIYGSSLRGSPSMAATPYFTDPSGLGANAPEYLYIADGRILWLHEEGIRATGALTATGAIANNDTVRLDGTYYKWTNGSVDTGAPAGTSGNPWLVALGASNTDALTNLRFAIGATGTAGTDYSTTLTAHTTVEPVSSSATTLIVQAISGGTAGNAIVTTETGANIAWGAGTLAGGSGGGLVQVAVPDDVGAVSVAYIAGYIIVVIAQGYGVNGRFYWIRPGAKTIDPLDFATAERAPDGLWSARVIGDQLWLLGQSTTEVWYPTGDGDAPFARVQGQLFDRGVWQGSDVQLKDSVILVDSLDGAVYAIGGGGPQRISDDSIEERVRKAMAAQEAWGL